MACIFRLLILCLLIFSTACKEEYVSQSNRNTIEMYQRGEINSAIVNARKTLQQIIKEYGDKHNNTAIAQENLASLLRLDDKHKEAGFLLQQARHIYQLNDSKSELARIHIDIALLKQSSVEPKKAKQEIDKAFKLLNADKQASYLDHIRALSTRSLIHQTFGEINKAESDLNKAITLIKEKRPEQDHQQTNLYAALLSQLASLYRTKGNLLLSKKLFEQVLNLQYQSLGVNHPELATTYNNLAEVDLMAGSYSSAKNYFFNALTILDHYAHQYDTEKAVILSNFSELEHLQGNFEQAVALISRAINIQNSEYTTDSPAIAPSLSRLAGIHYSAGNYRQALELSKQVFEIYQQQDDIDPAIIINVLLNIGETERRLGHSGSAIKHYKQAIALVSDTYGKSSILMANILANRGALYKQEKKFNLAKTDYLNAQKIIIKTLGANNPRMIDISYALALVLEAQGKLSDALKQIDKATKIIQKRLLSTDHAKPDASMKEVRSHREIIEKHISLIAKMDDSSKFIKQSYQLSQLAHASSTVLSTQKMAARFATGKDELSQLVRLLEAYQQQQVNMEKQFFQLASSAESSPGQLQQIQQNIQTISNQITSTEKQLSLEFPQFLDFFSMKGLKLKETQNLLNSKESLLSFLVSREHTYVWVIDANNASFHLLPIGKKQLIKDIKKLRHSLDPALITNFNLFDGETAYQLYQSLILPLKKRLKDTKKIIIVPDKALYTLPFEVLVASPEKIIAKKSFADTRWLVKQFAFSYLPSAVSLRAIRLYAKKSKAKNAFLGIGDPVLGEKYQPDTRRSTPASTIASKISMLTPLPETADELKIMANNYKESNHLILREKATELYLKNQVNLQEYKIIAFATHGVLAGELEQLDEPGLIMTPPNSPYGENDGYLKASEIAQLKLDSDWVLLSACNTASSDGTPDSDNLSGLSRAFFQAGTRALLVSHWSVWSEATVLLTTQTILNMNTKLLGKAEAHQKSILNLMQNAKYAHPMAWAPFVVIGDGY